MDPREQLLQTLMQDLANYQLPERFSDEKKAQVMKGRTKQADIDAGRAAIAENERLYQEALDKRGELQRQIQSLSGEIDVAKRKAAQDDPTNQAIQYGKSLGVPAAGYAAGHYAGYKFGKQFDADPQQRAAGVNKLAEKLRGLNRSAPTSRAETAAVIDTYDKTKGGRGAAQFLGPAALLGASAATQAGADYVDDPYLKEGLNLAASAERTGAVGMGLQQLADTLIASKRARQAVDPADVADIEASRRVLNEKGRYKGVQGSLEDAPVDNSAPKAAPKPGTRPALYAQAKEMGLEVTTRTKKGELEKKLAAALRKASKAGGRSASKAILPAAIGYGVYDALRTPAEAADGTKAAPMSRGKAAAIGAGAGVVGGAGIEKLKQALGRVPGLAKAGRAVGVGSQVLMPMIAADAYDPTQEQLNMDRNTAARYLPEFLQFGAVGRAGEMAEVPEPNPLRTTPSPGNQYYPLSSDLIRPEPEPQPQAAADDAMQPLIAAAEQDPETAEMIRNLIAARLAEIEAQ